MIEWSHKHFQPFGALEVTSPKDLDRMSSPQASRWVGDVSWKSWTGKGSSYVWVSSQNQKERNVKSKDQVPEQKNKDFDVKKK